MRLRNKKTGEIGFCEFHIVHSDPNAPLYYHSLREVLEDWEDVDSNNATNIPYIKDEKIRKTIRAWAEANEIVYIVRFDGTTLADCNNECYISFDVDESVFNDVPFGRNLTVDELCGEEE